MNVNPRGFCYALEFMLACTAVLPGVGIADSPQALPALNVAIRETPRHQDASTSLRSTAPNAAATGCTVNGRL